MAGPIANLRRLYAIARILAKHDALFPLEPLPAAALPLAVLRRLIKPTVDGPPGERLAGALQALGPSFIKLGQTLSTRPDLLGEDIAGALAELQDHLPPFSGADARAAIEEQLDAGVEDLFSAFEDEPAAAASIAQVHFATTTDGREVAVKVLRPGIEQAFAADIDLFIWLARIVERRRPELRRLKPVDVIQTFEESVRLEMDLRLEAAAAQELAENFADDPGYRVPEVDWQRTARRVLTVGRIAGVPIDERDRLLAAGHDLEDLLARAGAIFFKQVFRDGFFHADQHPGNLFVDEDGNLVAVDFGIMGRLDAPTRRYLGEMLMSFLERNYRRAAEVHFEAGYVPSHHSVEVFTQALRSIAEPILDRPQNEISIARLLAHLFQVTETFDMETQPQLLLLQKTMLVTEGVGRTLCPDLNVWFLAQALVDDWVADHMGAEARLLEAADEIAGGLRRLPRMVENMERSAEALAGGGVRLHPESLDAFGAAPSRKKPAAVYFVVAVLAVILGVVALS